MATLAKTNVAPADIAWEVIDPKAYAGWDHLLDTFDWLREHMPVARIERPEALHPPFWLVTRYDDVMRISKDNATFLNNPRTVVFSTPRGSSSPRPIRAGPSTWWRASSPSMRRST